MARDYSHPQHGCSPGLAASVIGVISSLSCRGGDSRNGVLSRAILGGVGSLIEALLTTLVGGGGGVSGTEMYDDKRSPDCLPIILFFSSGHCPGLHNSLTIHDSSDVIHSSLSGLGRQA